MSCSNKRYEKKNRVSRQKVIAIPGDMEEEESSILNSIIQGKRHFSNLEYQSHSKSNILAQMWKSNMQ